MNFQINFFFNGTILQCRYTGKGLAQMYKSDPVEISEQLEKKNYPLTHFVSQPFFFFPKKEHIL